MASTIISAVSSDIAMMDASVVIIAIVTLIALLIQKEIVGSLASARAVRLGQALDIGLVPLLLVLIATLAVRVLGVFR